MLNLEQTKIDYSVSAVVANAADITDEGMALVIAGAREDGSLEVKPSTGAANETFYGVSMFQKRAPKFMPGVVEFTLPDPVPASGTIMGTLPADPLGEGTAFENGVHLSHINVGDTSAGIAIQGRNIIIERTSGNYRHTNLGLADGLSPGAKIRFQFSWAPTDHQATMLVGTTLNHPLLAGARVDCIRKGIVYTSVYRTNIGYSIGHNVDVFSEGRFSIFQNRPIRNSTIIHVPTADNPFLGIEFF